MAEDIPFAGVIQKVTSDGQSAFVHLTGNGLPGVRVAVIGSHTIGRANLTNDGQLHVGTSVKGTARRGTDALKAVTVTLAAPEKFKGSVSQR
jgi:hypothetical protein